MRGLGVGDAQGLAQLIAAGRRNLFPAQIPSQQYLAAHLSLALYLCRLFCVAREDRPAKLRLTVRPGWGGYTRGRLRGVDVTATTSVSVSVPMPSTGDVITGGVTGSTVTGAGWSGSGGGVSKVWPNGSTPSSGGLPVVVSPVSLSAGVSLSGLGDTGAGWPGSSGGIFDVPNGSTPSSGGLGAGEAGWDFLTVGIPNCVLPNTSAISTPSFYLSLDRGRGDRARLPLSLGIAGAAGPPEGQNAPERALTPDRDVRRRKASLRPVLSVAFYSWGSKYINRHH